MRTGVITQKVGMTRLFLADGTHVPVTVLKLDGCAVTAVRTQEKDGYTAVQLGSGFAKPKNTNKAERGQFAKAEIEPRKQAGGIPRRCRQACWKWAMPLQADHFVAGQKVDVTGVTIGRGFTGAMKRWNFARSGSLARRVDLAPLAGRYRRPPGSGQDLQEQEDARPLRRREHHHPESGSGQGRCRARPDHGPRRGARLQGRLGDGARRRQAPAQGRARCRLP